MCEACFQRKLTLEIRKKEEEKSYHFYMKVCTLVCYSTYFLPILKHLSLRATSFEIHLHKNMMSDLTVQKVINLYSFDGQRDSQPLSYISSRN